MIKKSEIKTIRCKYCNKILGSAIQGCSCRKPKYWNNPSAKRTANRKHKLKQKVEQLQ